MKTLLKVSLVVLMAFGFCNVMAQPPRGDQNRQQQPATPEQRAKMTTQYLVKSLGLNAEQEKKVYALQLDMAKNRPVMKRDATPEEREANRTEMEKKMKEYNAKMKAILTTEQYQTWQKQMAAMRRPMRPGAQMQNQDQSGDQTKAKKAKKENNKKGKNKKAKDE